MNIQADFPAVFHTVWIIYLLNILAILFGLKSNISVGTARLDIDHNEKFHLFFKKNRYSGYTSVVLINNNKLFSTSPIWHLRYLIILMILAIASIVIYSSGIFRLNLYIICKRKMH